MTMWFLKQSTAVDVVIGPFVDDTDGKTPETALTISQADCQLTKNGGAVAQKNSGTAASHLGGGHYKVPLNATDTNTLGHLRLYVNEGGALPAWIDFMVVPANVYDSLIGGSDALQVHANEITANLITAAAIADNAIDGGALATTAVEKIADAVWEEPGYDHQLADPYTMGWLLHEAGSDWTELIADAVWDEALSAHDDAGSAGEALSGAGGGSTPSAIADAVWDEVMSGHNTPGTAGTQLTTASEGDLLGGSATAAENLRKAFDGTGYSANLAIAVVTNVTNHVLADLRRIGGSSTGDYAAFIDMLQGAVTATVVSGTNTTTVISTGLTSAVTGFYVGKTLFVASGTRKGEGGRVITAYDGATKRLTVSPALTAALAVGDKVLLIG